LHGLFHPPLLCQSGQRSGQRGDGGPLSGFGVNRWRAAWGATSRSAGLHAFWGQTALLLAVLAFANGSNYLFHVVISRMLGPSDYGALAALLGIVLVVGVTFGDVQ
jgi:hypothetical protein